MSCGQQHLAVEEALEIIVREIPHPMGWPWAGEEKERMRKVLKEKYEPRGITLAWLMEEYIPRAREVWYRHFDDAMAQAMEV